MIATFTKIANTRPVQSLTGIGKTLARRIIKDLGGGWQNVIVIQPERVNGEANKWWYTACTRGENQLTIISSMSLDALWQNAIQRSSFKDSSLFERVREGAKSCN